MSACSAATAAQELFALADKTNIPLNMMCELTYRCNEKCLHCYLPETQGLRAPRVADELTAAEWGRAFEGMAEAGTLYLILTGGEVLLRPIFPDPAPGPGQAFSVEIFTNAVLLTPEIADEWAEQAVQNVGVSIYSPSAVVHDRVTKLAGSFENTLRGVRLLKERGVAVKLKTPMMKLNLANYQALIDLAAEIGVPYQFDPMIVPRNDGSTLPVRLGLDDERLESMYREERLVPADDVLLARPLGPGDSPCSAGRTSGAVGPYGDVVPCIQWMVPAGNLRERSFADIWREGSVLGRARTYTGKDLKPCEECGQPHFIHCFGMSQLEKRDPLASSSEACRLTKTMRAIQATQAAPLVQMEAARTPQNTGGVQEKA